VIDFRFYCSSPGCTTTAGTIAEGQDDFDSFVRKIRGEGWLVAADRVTCPACLETRELLAMEARR
jgi:hypothetical protein